MKNQPSLFVLGSFVVACSAHVSRFPQRGESATAAQFVVEPGGKGFNLAIAAHRLGANVYSIFSIGDDLFSHAADQAFASAGLTPTRVRRCRGATGCGIGFVDAVGETCLAVSPGSNLELDAEDVAAVADTVAQAQVVLAQFEIADAPIEAAFALARRHQAVTILNPSPFRMPSPGILRDTDVLVVNEVEAEMLAAALGIAAAFDGPMLAPAAVAAILACGPRTLIVTLGPRGAILHREAERPMVQPAFPVAAIDTLGAGDAFLAAYAVSLAAGASVATCLRRANAAGGLATLAPGVLAALATRDALDAFLAERQSEAHPL